MAIGVDEQLTIAINAEAERFYFYDLEEIDTRQIAEQLHGNYSHRTVKSIENRLKLVLWSRGLFSDSVPRSHITTQ